MTLSVNSCPFTSKRTFGRPAFFNVLSSRKAIRLYEKKNIIKPVEVDAQNGYRYYSVDQIQQLNEDKILQANLYNKEYQELMKKERENTAQVYAKEKLSHKRILNAIIISIMLFILVWQLIDFFILKNADNLFWKTVEFLVEKTPLEEQIEDYFVAGGTFICFSVIGTSVAYLSRIFYSDEAIEKFKEKKKQKFLKKADEQDIDD